MFTRENFPSRLKALREAIGISQGEFAKALGVARASIGYYESGQRLPDIEFLDQVHELTGCSVNYLMGYDSNMGEYSNAIAAYTGLNDDAIEALNYFDQASINFILASENFDHMSYILTMLTDPAICVEYFDTEEALEFMYYQVQIYARKLAIEMYKNELLKQNKAIEKEYSPHYSDIEKEMTEKLENVEKVGRYIKTEKAKNATKNVLVWPHKPEWITEEDYGRAETDPIMLYRLRLQAFERSLQKNEEIS